MLMASYAEKHLDVYNSSASVFFNERVLYRAIQQCLNNPNTENRNGKRFEMTKTFGYDIGVFGFTSEPSNKIKVIFNRTKKKKPPHFRGNCLSSCMTDKRCSDKFSNTRR